MAHKRVYLIRHGQTQGNAKKRYIGRRSDESLSKEGMRAAKTVSSVITDLVPDKPDRFCASPMRRAVQTADLLFQSPALTLIDDLAEMDFGCFEGKDHGQLNGDVCYQKWIDSNGEAQIPGGEAREAFCVRSYAAFLKALGEKTVSETIVIVCHGGTVMAVMSRLIGGDFYDYMTENLGGYCLDLELDDEGIHDVAYHRLCSWGNP
ncbi:MAG: histidine phosphatase family protein [Lachnospiraceae bacterium]|nr:histidine phosphatase family protein [Lachnospiraceae bacterium]